MKFIKNLSTKKIFLYLLIYSILSLSFALFLEYVLNYKPCQLCLYQRIPYLLILIFSFVLEKLYLLKSIIFKIVDNLNILKSSYFIYFTFFEPILI